MIITTHIQESAFNILVNYKMYRPAMPSKNFLLCFHGIGEIGPADGSTINKVEIHGYPKHAKNGFEFPFNLIAVQAQSSYTNIRKNFPGYIKLKYGAESVGATGLSMGGFCTFDIPVHDSAKVVDFIAPVCGGISVLQAPGYPEIPGWAFHGDKDTTVNFRKSKDFVDKYNETHQMEMKYTLYPGVAHNAWDKAYATDGELLQWIIGQFEAYQHTSDKFQLAKDFINSL